MSNLTARPDISGLRPEITFDTTKPLFVFGIYGHILALMSTMAQASWEGWIVHKYVIGLPGGTAVKITLTPTSTTGPPERPSSLQNGYAIVSLYDLGIAVAKENKFFTANCDIVVVGVKTGNIKVEERTEERTEEQQGALLEDGLTLVDGPLNLTDLSIPANHDLAALPVDPRSYLKGNFKIEYEYDGARVSPTDIFTACLDGFATSAPHPSTDVVSAVSARSLSNDCAINVRGVGLPSRFTWDHVIRTFSILFVNIMLGLRAFGEMRFSIFLDSAQIGTGFVLKPQRLAQNSTENITSS